MQASGKLDRETISDVLDPRCISNHAAHVPLDMMHTWRMMPTMMHISGESDHRRLTLEPRGISRPITSSFQQQQLRC